MLELLIVLNAIWFFMGFNVFSLRGTIFAKIVVAREHRDTPVLDTLIHSGKFLGGFNLAFSLLNVLLLLNISQFDKNIHWVVLLAANAVAHGTQFFYNLPVAIQNRKGEGIWEVLKGTMLFIFITDFVLMTANSAGVIWYLF